MKNYIESVIDWGKLQEDALQYEKLGKDEPSYIIMSEATLELIVNSSNSYSPYNILMGKYSRLYGIPIAVCDKLKFGDIDIVY